MAPDRRLLHFFHVCPKALHGAYLSAWRSFENKPKRARRQVAQVRAGRMLDSTHLVQSALPHRVLKVGSSALDMAVQPCPLRTNRVQRSGCPTCRNDAHDSLLTDTILLRRAGIPPDVLLAGDLRFRRVLRTPAHVRRRRREHRSARGACRKLTAPFIQSSERLSRNSLCRAQAPQFGALLWICHGAAPVLCGLTADHVLQDSAELAGTTPTEAHLA